MTVNRHFVLGRRLTCALLPVLIAFVALAAHTERAGAFSHSIKRGSWSAQVTYKRRSGHGTYTMFRRLRVTIKHRGKTVFKRRPVLAEQPLGTLSMGRPRWRVANLDADAEPEFLLRWGNGCTHSCTRANAFGVGASNAATIPIYMWDGFRVGDYDGNGIAELRGSDSRFSYQFANYASSGEPLIINSLASGSVVDVTRSFPGLIEVDAQEMLNRWEAGAKYSEGGGVALAYAGDLCRLNRYAEAVSFLADAEDSTTVPLADSLDYGYDPDYAENALAFLKSVGYC